MAQRTIHYLFGEIISQEITITNKERFLLGSILPDAAEAADRDLAHFKTRTDTQVYYDFEAFRHQYTYLLQKDELYLGYYMHLVEDAFYRAFIYRDGVVMPRTKEEVTLLHNDYHILNSYIVEKYGIRYIFPDKVCLENEPIYAIADFNINGFLAEMAGDFAEQTNGDPIFLTRRMLDAFTETYIPPAVEEIRKIKSGRSALKATDYAWQRNR